MSVNIGDFVGSWTVQWIAGSKPALETDWQLLIGTGTEGDKPPFLDQDFAVCVGFTLLDENGKVEISTTPPNGEDPQQDLLFLLDGGTLRWAGYYQGMPLRIYVSVAVARTAGDSSYTALYGSTTWGDPDQVGVWGADARPPGG